MQKFFEWIQHEKYGWLSWPLFEKRCFVISWCVWKNYWHMLKIWQAWFLPLFYSPGWSWDAILKMTGMRLKKIVDIDMYLFIEKGLRGGMFYIAKR